MHIQDQVTAELINQGWDRQGADFRFTKMVPTGGQFGRAIATLIMDESGRWLESIDAWGYVVKDVDLRNFRDNPKAAISAVIG